MSASDNTNRSIARSTLVLSVVGVLSLLVTSVALYKEHFSDANSLATPIMKNSPQAATTSVPITIEKTAGDSLLWPSDTASMPLKPRDISNVAQTSPSNFDAKELCDRDKARMGAYGGYQFTESPYCATDSIPKNKLILAEIPHRE